MSELTTPPLPHQADLLDAFLESFKRDHKHNNFNRSLAIVVGFWMFVGGLTFALTGDAPFAPLILMGLSLVPFGLYAMPFKVKTPWLKKIADFEFINMSAVDEFKASVKKRGHALSTDVYALYKAEHKVRNQTVNTSFTT